MVDDPDSVPVSTDELRRYLRHVGKLLAAVESATDGRAQLLRRARHWLDAVGHGVDLLLVEAQYEDTVELPRRPQ